MKPWSLAFRSVAVAGILTLAAIFAVVALGQTKAPQTDTALVQPSRPPTWVTSANPAGVKAKAAGIHPNWSKFGTIYSFAGMGIDPARCRKVKTDLTADPWVGGRDKGDYDRTLFRKRYGTTPLPLDPDYCTGLGGAPGIHYHWGQIVTVFETVCRDSPSFFGVSGSKCEADSLDLTDAFYLGTSDGRTLESRISAEYQRLRGSLSIVGVTSGVTGAAYIFTASGSGSCAPAAGGWSWEVGEGQVTRNDGAEIVVSWLSAGDKTLTVRNSSCPTAVGSAEIRIQSPPPVPPPQPPPEPAPEPSAIERAIDLLQQAIDALRGGPAPPSTGRIDAVLVDPSPEDCAAAKALIDQGAASDFQRIEARETLRACEAQP